jgi:NAD(P)-dependent dehydrogenase (short-subunit alcohol dehydrogenase family)
MSSQTKSFSSAMEEVLDIIPPAPIAAEALGLAPGRERLVGRHILVVGGGQSVNDFDANPPIGNGKAISVLCAREGAEVVVADISQDAAERTAEAIRKEGGKAHVVTGDASTKEGCSDIVQKALEALGGSLDGLVIGVGVVGAGPDYTPYSAEYWDRVMNVNLRSHFLILQNALPFINASPAGGAAVSISSISQYLPASNEPAYNASKAGLSVLIKNIAYQYAPRIRINTVVPGLIDTPMGRSAGLKIKGRNASAVPLARQGSGWDVAYAVIWLLSGESSYITAQDIVVDGGRVGTGGKGAKTLNAEVSVS